MKLISCHVENFGKLSGVNLSFAEGLNTFCNDNGWGKSTLAAFIRALFYGLEGDGKVDVMKNERKRFAPWQGGAFGGSIVFETHGKTYEMTRFFGAKAAEDTFELRDRATNLESTDYSEKIGEELFHINSESFMNTVFISQSDAASSKATDDVNARLGNISDGMDLNRYANAESIIKDTLNAMSATRKTGEIAKDKAYASELKSRIRNGQGIESTMAAVSERIKKEKDELENCKKELSELSLKKKEALRVEKLLNDKEAYEKLLNEYKDKENLLKSRRDRFPGKVPASENGKALEDTADRLREAQALYEGTRLEDTEEALYNTLLNTFKEGVPSEPDIDRMIDDAEECARLRGITEKHSLTEAEQDKLSRYNNIYKDPHTLEADVNGALNDWNDRSRMLNEARFLERDLSDKEYAYGEKGGRKGLMLLGLFLVLAGAVLLLCDSVLKVESPVRLSYFSYLAFGLGLVFLLLQVKKSLSSGQDKRVRAAEINDIKERLSEYRDKSADIEEATQNLLYSFGIAYDEINVPKALQGILYDSYDYKALLEKAGMASEYDYTKKCAELSAGVNAFLYKYSTQADESRQVALLTDLKGKISHFNLLSKKNRDHKRAAEEATRLRSELESGLSQYDIDISGNLFEKVEDLLDAVTEYESVRELFNDVEGRLEAFKNDKNIEEIMAASQEGAESVEAIHDREEELNSRADTLREAILTDTRTLDDCAENYDTWQEDVEELKELEESIAEKQHRLKLIELTGTILTEAKESLTARYMEPLLTGFSKYYTALTGDTAAAYKIDVNTNITVEEKGKQRNVDTLSYGYRDLIGFCMRLAMADAMYTGEKPTLIMDDPFVNLDDRKLEGAEKLLEVVAKDYQVLYLTCRSERKL
ncbi:MAG: AAA family ATPase [Lachnospiraceae bacterium]|nr:AAA family ATPase [Lachnospiraceae bacterium]